LTFPSDPTSWTESLTPAEGSWHSVVGAIYLSTVNDGIQPHSVECISDGYHGRLYYQLNNGREFNGMLDQAELHFKIALYGPWFDAAIQSVVLYDAAGYWAYLDLRLGPVDGVFHEFDLPLGPTAGWTMQTGFDWRYISRIHINEDSNGTANMYIERLCFSYYQLVLGILNVLAESAAGPIIKQFSVDSGVYVTPAYNLGLMPSVDYTVSIDTVNFREWDDGGTNPQRTVNLNEAQALTIIAYYNTPIPPPPSGYATAAAGVAVFGGLIAAAYLYRDKIKRFIRRFR
jgi:hypothetical protein